MRFPQGAEWLIILVLILLLFGAKRLPDMARSLGRSARILKSETKGLRDDENADAQGADQQALPAAPPAPATPAPPAPPVAQATEEQTKPTAS
ncbi:MAG: Sec-independent protein translocase subunit TatA [Candidatus Nanopelagicales bacterium]